MSDTNETFPQRRWSRSEGRRWSRNEGRVGTRNEGRVGTRNEGRRWSRNEGRVGTRNAAREGDRVRTHSTCADPIILTLGVAVGGPTDLSRLAGEA